MHAEITYLQENLLYLYRKQYNACYDPGTTQCLTAVL